MLTRSAPEPVHQVGKRLLGGFRTAVGKRLADMAFAAPGEDVPVPARRLGQRVEVVAQDLPFSPPARCAVANLARQPSIALRPAGQHQQVRPWRVGRLGAVAAAERQFGAEHRRARRVPWPPRRSAPPRTARRGRSARWRADRAGRPPRRVPPACSRRRGSCTPNARAVRRTGTDERVRRSSAGS